MSPYGGQNGEHPRYHMSGLGSCRKWQSFELAPAVSVSAVDRVYTLRPFVATGVTRLSWKVESVYLVDGSGEAELSRTIFGHTSWLQVWR
jgi:hypothetical protein